MYERVTCHAKTAGKEYTMLVGCTANCSCIRAI